MSIINKMHQDFNSVQQEQPILSNMPKEKRRQKTVLQIFVLLLLVCTLGLSYLIFSEKQLSNASPVSNIAVTPVRSLSAAIETKLPLVNAEKDAAIVKNISKATAVIAEVEVQAKEPLAVKKVKNVTLMATDTAVKMPRRNVTKKAAPTAAVLPISVAENIDTEKKKQLEIKTAQLTNAQLAQIHLQAADKAESQGDLLTAAQSRLRALSLQPTLNEVRKSVVLYYYAQGDLDKASGLLQKGALVSPEYADFNLMLSRIALKAGDFYKAYLYLQKHPPQVAGNLDYYASHAALSQKFKKYAQAESLYISLLSQRPDNGRWRMSLAIAQDKQSKTAAALKNYKNALLQTDLSAKAKDYIKQRLTYLAEN